MSRTRAGRKSWNTRVNFNNQVGDFFRALANAPAPKFDNAATKAWIVERTAKADDKKDVMTFNQAYAQLQDWLGLAFSNISEDGFSDMLAAMFFEGTQIHTLKAEYRLWVKPGH